jgi:Flp pilus assembly protein TadD
VSLHILSALALFGIIRLTLLTPKLRERFTRPSDGLALASALIWMVHPLQTESVNYITQRTELMVGLFYLLTMYCAIRALGSSVTDRWHAAAIVSCLVGMGCKESMVTAPVMVVLYDRIFIFESNREAWRRRKTLYAGLSLSWIEFAALLTSRAHMVTGFSYGVSTWTYLLNQTQMILQYLKLTVWPSALVLDYGVPRRLVLVDVLPQAIVVVSLALLTVVGLAVRPMAGFLGAWFFITLAPASSFLPIVTEVGAERRMYLPLAALVVVAVFGGWRLLEMIGRRARLPSAIVAVAAVVVALGYATVRRNQDYASAVTLLQSSVDRWPHGRAHVNLAAVLKEQGRVDEAMAHLRAALPDNPLAHYVLGSELYDLGQFDEAIKELWAFIARNPTSTYQNVAARNLIALSLAQQGKLGAAIKEFRVALEMDPGNAGLHGNLAYLLLQQNDFEGARRHYEAYLSRHTGSAFVLTNLGIALQHLGRLEEASERFRQALAIDPNHVEARSRLDQTSGRRQ